MVISGRLPRRDRLAKILLDFSAAFREGYKHLGLCLDTPFAGWFAARLRRRKAIFRPAAFAFFDEALVVREVLEPILKGTERDYVQVAADLLGRDALRMLARGFLDCTQVFFRYAFSHHRTFVAGSFYTQLNHVYAQLSSSTRHYKLLRV